jgi:hypothetical protein
VPHGQQALLLLRTLAYDRNLAARASADATVLVLFKPGDAASAAARDAMPDFESATSALGTHFPIAARR